VGGVADDGNGGGNGNGDGDDGGSDGGEVSVGGQYDPDTQLHGAYLLNLAHWLTAAEKRAVVGRYKLLGYDLSDHLRDATEAPHGGGGATAAAGAAGAAEALVGVAVAAGEAAAAEAAGCCEAGCCEDGAGCCEDGAGCCEDVDVDRDIVASFRVLLDDPAGVAAAMRPSQMGRGQVKRWEERE
jgi:hypothetical protein